MKVRHSRRQPIAALAAIVLVGVLAAIGRANAVVIAVTPASSAVSVGDTFGIDIVVSGLDAGGEIVSAFDLDLAYDAGLVSAAGITFSPLLGVPDVDAFTAGVFSSGRVDFANLSLLSNLDLAALQGDSVLLARLTFRALDAATAALNLDPLAAPGVALVGLDPFSLLPIDRIGNASVLITRPTTVPQPGSLALIALALIAIAIVKRTSFVRSVK